MFVTAAVATCVVARTMPAVPIEVLKFILPLGVAFNSKRRLVTVVRDCNHVNRNLLKSRFRMEGKPRWGTQP